MRTKEALDVLLPLWAERFGERPVRVDELDALAREVGKSLMYSYRVGGRPVRSALYNALVAGSQVRWRKRPYTLIRRRRAEWWDDVWILRPQLTAADEVARLAADRQRRLEAFVRSWADAYDDLPATTDQLVEIASEMDWWFGRPLSQRARQVSLARAIRRRVGTVIDGWRIAEPSRSRPTKWRLVRVGMPAEAISAAG
jgi:hypothetical protein